MRDLIPKSKEGFRALADQGVVSLGMPASHILLARQFTDYECGVYGILLGLLLSLNTAHSALVSYPLALEAADAGRGSIRRSTGAVLLGRPSLAAWGFAALLFRQGQVTGACAGLVGMQLVRAGCSVFFVRRRGLGGLAVAVT